MPGVVVKANEDTGSGVSENGITPGEFEMILWVRLAIRLREICQAAQFTVDDKGWLSRSYSKVISPLKVRKSAFATLTYNVRIICGWGKSKCLC
ncbi:hypothetical protein ES703_71573 [subsurface metagenome]